MSATESHRLRTASLIRWAAATGADGRLLLPSVNGEVAFLLGSPVAVDLESRSGPAALAGLAEALAEPVAVEWQGPQWLPGPPKVNLVMTAPMLLNALGLATEGLEAPTGVPNGDTSIAGGAERQSDQPLPHRSLLPPLPAGVEVPLAGRGFFALVNSLDEGLVVADRPVRGAAVVVAGQLKDAVAEGHASRQFGPAAIDVLLDAGTRQFAVYQYPGELLLALTVFWRAPEAVAPIAARHVRGPDVVRAFLKPAQHGAVLAIAAADTAVCIFRGAQVMVAYRIATGQRGGLELLDDVLALPGAQIQAVLGTVQAAEQGQVLVAGTAERMSKGGDGAMQLEPFALAASITDEAPWILEQVAEVARQELHAHAEPVLDILATVPLTAEGLHTAIDRIRELRIRFVSPLTMERIAEQAELLLGQGRP